MPEDFSPNTTLPAATDRGVRSLVSKVPEVTALFWVIKVLTTGMGETTSDYLAHTIDPVIAVGIGAVCFAAALALQFSVKRYIPWVYWLAVAMVSVFGTMAADVLHVGLGIPYVASTIFYAVVLAAVFFLWHRTEKTLSIHSIHSPRREMFYWAAVLATFALGTAAGDLTAVTLQLGYLGSGVLFAVAIAVPALAYWKFGLKAIPAFWAAYIVTRPLGASFADWMGVSHARGGLDWGTAPVSLGWAAAIVVLVAVLAALQRRTKAQTGA
ncbi:hypothetical protein [Arthrobacter sp. SDTb3-6]|uniref:COG4705 family protein n=1 Tax=Arthrobacter sp. SDTb3-6 TaxID=2713571 RepID=UPI00159DD423|nr:hypothetical protein [Arthrobacter sp. SDTb3-6]NVM99011.1 hypothetical protein [Arthrobacter sp. SDTb3-6]